MYVLYGCFKNLISSPPKLPMGCHAFWRRLRSAWAVRRWSWMRRCDRRCRKWTKIPRRPWPGTLVRHGGKAENEHYMGGHDLSIYLSTYPSIHPSVHPSIHLSIFLSFYLSIYLPTYLSNYLIHTNMNFFKKVGLNSRGHKSPNWDGCSCFIGFMALGLPH